ncbi:hypothetical protein BCEP27_40238 [Burkholderia cepacia]
MLAHDLPMHCKQCQGELYFVDISHHEQAREFHFSQFEQNSPIYPMLFDLSWLIPGNLYNNHSIGVNSGNQLH